MKKKALNFNSGGCWWLEMDTPVKTIIVVKKPGF